MSTQGQLEHLLTRVQSLLINTAVNVYAASRNILIAANARWLGRTLFTRDEQCFIQNLYKADQILRQALCNIQPNDTQRVLGEFKQSVTLLAQVRVNLSHERNLMAAIYTYWHLQKPADAGAENIFSQLLNCLPTEPILTYRNAAQNNPMDEKREKCRQILAGDFAGIDDLRGCNCASLGFSRCDETKLQSIFNIFNALHAYQSKQLNLARFISILSGNYHLNWCSAKIDSNLTEQFDSVFKGQSLATVVPDMADLAKKYPGFCEKLKTALENETLKSREKLKTALSKLISSPWPLSVPLEKVLQNIPDIREYNNIKNCLQKIHQLNQAEANIDIELLNKLGLILNDLTNSGELSRLFPDLPQHHKNIQFIIQFFPLQNGAVQNTAYDLFENNWKRLVTKKFASVVESAVNEALRKHIIESLINNRPIAPNLLAVFKDLAEFNEILEQIQARSAEFLKENIDCLMTAWEALPELRGLLNKRLCAAFNAALPNLSYPEVLNSFATLLKRPYHGIISCQLLNDAVFIASHLNDPEFASIDSKFWAVFNQTETLNALGHWLNDESIPFLCSYAFNIPISDMPWNFLAACYLRRSSANKHEMNLDIVRLITAVEPANHREIELLLPQWIQYTKNTAPELKAIMCWCKNENSIPIIKPLTPDQRRRLAKFTVFGRESSDFLRENIANCSGIDDFMVLVAAAKDFGRPFQFTDLPKAIINADEIFSTVNNAIDEFLREGESRIKNTLLSLRKLKKLALSPAYQNFIQWYAEQAIPGNERERCRAFEQIFRLIKVIDCAQLHGAEREIFFPSEEKFSLDEYLNAFANLSEKPWHYEYDDDRNRMESLHHILLTEDYKLLMTLKGNIDLWKQAIEKIQRDWPDVITADSGNDLKRKIEIREHLLNKVKSNEIINNLYDQEAAACEADKILSQFICKQLYVFLWRWRDNQDAATKEEIGRELADLPIQEHFKRSFSQKLENELE